MFFHKLTECSGLRTRVQLGETMRISLVWGILPVRELPSKNDKYSRFHFVFSILK